MKYLSVVAVNDAALSLSFLTSFVISYLLCDGCSRQPSNVYLLSLDSLPFWESSQQVHIYTRFGYKYKQRTKQPPTSCLTLRTYGTPATTAAFTNAVPFKGTALTEDRLMYQRLIGQIIYLITQTRPDLAFAVSL